MITRNGLAESLEEYAARAGATAFDARPFWRAEAMRLLGFEQMILRNRYAAARSPRVAPGVAVPVRLQLFGDFMTPADVIEVEP